MGLGAYISLGLGAALAGSIAYGQWGWNQVDTLETRLAKSGMYLASCNSQLRTLRDDKESDDEIDNISDGDLNAVPDHWLHTPGD